MFAHLLIQILQFIPWELKLSYLRQDSIPPPTIDIRNKCLNTVDSVQRNLALSLQRLKGLVQGILFAKLKHNLDHTEPNKLYAVRR